MASVSIPKEYLGAFKAGHRPCCRAYIDEELSWVLLKKIIRDNCETSRATLQYITKFNNEYYKGVVKAGDETALHSTDESKRQLWKDAYSRKMDALTRFDTVYMSENFNHITESNLIREVIEDDETPEILPPQNEESEKSLLKGRTPLTGHPKGRQEIKGAFMSVAMSKAEFEKSKLKRKTKQKPAEKVSEIPKDLEDMWGAVTACATAFNTMQAGSYTHTYLSTLHASLNFLKALHTQSVEEALKHPQADLIPELKKIREDEAAKAVANGAQ